MPTPFIANVLIITSPPYNIGKSYEKKVSLSNYLKWQEEILEKQMRDTGPHILIGNSILFDFPGHAPSIDIPLLKPVGIAMKTPRPHYPLRGISGYNQLTLMLEGKGKGNVLFGE